MTKRKPKTKRAPDALTEDASPNKFPALMTMRQAANYVGWTSPNGTQRMRRTLLRLERTTRKRILTRAGEGTKRQRLLVTRGAIRASLPKFRGRDRELETGIADLLRSLNGKLREIIDRLDEHDSLIAALDVRTRRVDERLLRGR